MLQKTSSNNNGTGNTSPVFERLRGPVRNSFMFFSAKENIFLRGTEDRKGKHHPIGTHFSIYTSQNIYNLLPPSQIISRFDLSRFIGFALKKKDSHRICYTARYNIHVDAS